MAIWQRDVPKGSPQGFSPTSGSTRISPVYATGDQANVADSPASDVPEADPRSPWFRSASNPSSLSHGFVVLLEIFLRQILVGIVAALVVAAIARQ